MATMLITSEVGTERSCRREWAKPLSPSGCQFAKDFDAVCHRSTSLVLGSPVWLPVLSQWLPGLGVVSPFWQWGGLTG